MTTSAQSKWRAALGRTGVRASLLVALFVAGLVLRAWSSSGEELERAELARTGGDLEAAIDHYRRAAVWDFPGNVRASRALEALLEIGEDAQRAGNATLALAAYRSVHGATMSARHLVVPHDDLRLAADEQIATLMAEGAVPPVDAHRAPDERASVYLAMLREDRDASTLFALMALLGFAGWVSGGAMLLQRGFDAEGELVGREVRRWGTVLVVGFGLFVLGLALA
ncbi:MAG: hypothetical protein K1X94_28905 [Sandaracinaceae bacterium]|nr:hypothetical protein [Sandaracinaceae bacterium]